MGPEAYYSAMLYLEKPNRKEKPKNIFPGKGDIYIYFFLYSADVSYNRDKMRVEKFIAQLY